MSPVLHAGNFTERGVYETGRSMFQTTQTDVA
jgi:hypothetical protein